MALNWRVWLVCVATLPGSPLLAACGPQTEAAHIAPQPGAIAEPAAVAAPGHGSTEHDSAGPDGTLYGEPLRSGLQVVSVRRLTRRGAELAGQVVETSGTIKRVCTRMGCWLELESKTGSDSLRVPMAGHAFFVPQEIVGSTAVVQGKVAVRVLTDAQKAHYRSEGMAATDNAVSVHATSVHVASLSGTSEQ